MQEGNKLGLTPIILSLPQEYSFPALLEMFFFLCMRSPPAHASGAFMSTAQLLLNELR